MKVLPLTGNLAAAEAMRQINPDVVAIYPITPQSEIAEKFAEFVANGEVTTELICVESEHSAMSACVGASAAGARAMTATASQGLALMWEILSVASGLRLPIVMPVSNRALSAPINIHCDHSDSMGARDLGWIQIYSENPQEVYHNVIFALRLAELVNLPAMVMQDGFVTSHCVENVAVLEDEQVREFIGERKAPYNFFDFENPVTLGPFALPNYFFEIKRQQFEGMREASEQFKVVAKEFEELIGKPYEKVEAFEVEDADFVIVTMSSSAGTAKQVARRLREKGEKVGVLKIRLFRPFPYNEVAKLLAGKKLAVLDRSLSLGAMPPLFTDVKLAVKSNCEVQSYVFGLGGRDLLEEHVEKVFRDLKEKPIEEERIRFLGVRE